MGGQALALLGGTLAAQCLPALPPASGVLALALGAGLLGWCRPRWRLLVIVLLAACWAMWRADLAMQARLPAALEQQDIEVQGQVVGLPTMGPGATRFVLVVERAWHADQPLAFAGRIRLSWYDAPPGRPSACSRWRLQVRLKRPRSLLNPGGFDSERAALVRRENAFGYVRGQAAEALAGPAWCVDRWRHGIAAAISERLADHRAGALLRALTVGDTQGLAEDDWEIARANGVSHLLAISGFHVGIAGLLGAGLIGGLWWLLPGLGKWQPRRSAQAVGALALAIVYGALAGFGLPTVRSVLMIAVVAAACCWRRHPGGLPILAWALIVVLIFDPLAVLAAGFWLSFGGVGLLMLGLIAARQRAYWRVLAKTELLLTLALLPLTAWFFGQASLLGAVSNLLAIPVVSFVVVPLALGGALLWPLSASLAGLAWSLAGLTVAWLWQALARLALLPGLQWYPPSLSLLTVALATMGALMLFLPRGLPGRWLGLVLFLPIFHAAPPALERGAFQMWNIDVGQGLSVLLRTRHHALLFDAGARYPSGFDLGRAAVLPTLRALGVRRLDVIMISHADNDHAGGAAAIVQAFPEARRLAGEPEKTGLDMQACHAGQRWHWDRVQLTVLHPDSDSGLSGNPASCVLLVQGGGGQALLTGDLTAAYEGRVAARLPRRLPTVLQVPHHGSKTSSSQILVDAARPVLAVASSGWGNPFRHPAPVVVERYEKSGAKFLDTATSGNIAVSFPAQSVPYVFREWRRFQRRYWRE